MGKSSGSGCLGIIACGHNDNAKESKKTKFNNGEVSQTNTSKRRWGFQKKPSHTRVLRTNVANEPFSPRAERNEEGLIPDQGERDLTLIPEKCSLSTLLERTDVKEETIETSIVTEINVSDAVDSGHHADQRVEESSVIKIQAAIRGYLARRELCRLKRIVKLQGLVRGQLVRKQAARTLRCAQAIIRLQALVRAHRVRSSDQGKAIQEKLKLIRHQNGSRQSKLETNGSNISVNNTNILQGKLFSNGFANQLLQSVPKADSPNIKYDQNDPNSGWKWLERWMATSPAESDLSARTKNVTKHQSVNQNSRSPEHEAAEKGLHSNLVSASNLLVVEADKQKFSLTKESKSISTTSDKLQSEDGRSTRSSMDVSKSVADPVAQRLNKQLERVSKSDFSKLVLNQPGVEPNHSDVILKQKSYSTEGSCSDQTKIEAENCLCSSTETPNLTSDSVLGQLNMASKENSNPMKDSVDEVYKEAEITKPSSMKVSNSIPNFVSDSSEVKTESLNSMPEEVSNLTLHSIPTQVEDEVEKSAHNSSKILTSKLNAVLDQPTVGENSKPKFAKHKSNSGQFNGEAEKSMPSSTMVSNLTLSSVSDDTSMEPEKLSNSEMHSISSELQSVQAPTFCSSSDHLESLGEAENNMDKSSSSKFVSVSDKLEATNEKVMSNSMSLSASGPSKSVSDDLNGSQDTVKAVQQTTLIQVPVSSSEISDNSGARQSIDSYAESIPTDKCETPTKNDSENSGIEQKATRRRSSFDPEKADNSASDSHGSPSLPRYMTATASAKAKFRPLNSPKSSPDAQEVLTNAKRRNSLSGSHGKQHSGSPNVQRSLSQVQRTTNGSGVHSPRDSAEKPKQADWRR